MSHFCLINVLLTSYYRLIVDDVIQELCTNINIQELVAQEILLDQRHI